MKGVRAQQRDAVSRTILLTGARRIVLGSLWRGETERVQAEDCPAIGCAGSHSGTWFDGEACDFCGALPPDVELSERMKPMQWFGGDWGAPICQPSNRAEIPIGEPCAYCSAPISETDCGVVMTHVEPAAAVDRPWHLLCFFKALGFFERREA